jgi:hypothetical protein
VLHYVYPNIDIMLVQRAYYSNVALDTIALDIEVKWVNRIIFKMT